MKYVIIILLSSVLLVSGCAHNKQIKTPPPELPVVVLEHDDGKEDWGRLLSMEEDSLIIRGLDDMQLAGIDPQDIVAVYIVEPEPANYPLAILGGLVVMGGTWGVVAAVYGDEASSGTVFLTSAVGVLPAIYAAVRVADWTRGFRIIPLDIQGSDGRLDVSRLRQEIINYLMTS
jgi:hypothetical protein